MKRTFFWSLVVITAMLTVIVALQSFRLSQDNSLDQTLNLALTPEPTDQLYKLPISMTTALVATNQAIMIKLRTTNPSRRQTIKPPLQLSPTP